MMLDAQGKGRTSDVIRAVEYATAQRAIRAAAWATHIVWGTSYIGEVEGDHIVRGTVTDPGSTVWGNLGEAPPGDQ